MREEDYTHALLNLNFTSYRLLDIRMGIGLML
jgi:hypothetical protein